MMVGLNKKLRPALAHDDGVVLVPFGFTINGVSDPDGLIGDLLESVTRTEAGEFLCTLKARPAKCYFGEAAVSETTDDTQISARVDWSEVESAGTFTVRVFGAPTATLTTLTGTTALTSNAITGETGLTGTTEGGPPGTCAITAGDLTITNTAGTCTLTSGAGTTTGVQVDPTDNRLVGGFLLVSKTSREARR